MHISNATENRDEVRVATAARTLSRRLFGTRLSVSASLAGLAAALVVGSAPGYAANITGSFGGNAYAAAASAQAGPVSLSLGQVAFIPCPCNGTNGNTISNQVATVSGGTAGSVITAGVAKTTVYATKTSTQAVNMITASITGLNLLGGLITADVLKAEANVTATATTISASSTGTTFTNLKVLGQKIDINVAPNTRIDLPNIGTVTLLKTAKGGSFTNYGQILVEVISIDVNHSNTLGLGIGARIVVGHAIAGYNRFQPPAIVAGAAYAAAANAAIGKDLQAQIGQAAAVSVGCLGTGGKTLTNTIAALNVNGILTSGTGNTTAFGGPLNGGTVVKTTATVQGLNLLGGLIGASAITAAVQETYSNGVMSHSFAGTQFLGLKVLGITIPLNVAPNTLISLPLLGTVVVNEQTTEPVSLRSQVNGLHVTVTSSLNLLGLPVGAEIIVAHADAHALKF